MSELPATFPMIEDLKPVCLCRNVKHGTIRRAIAAGHRSVRALQKRTLAATGPCGAKRCGDKIREMLETF